jgi:hypothetical protein
MAGVALSALTTVAPGSTTTAMPSSAEKTGALPVAPQEKPVAVTLQVAAWTEWVVEKSNASKALARKVGRIMSGNS